MEVLTAGFLMLASSISKKKLVYTRGFRDIGKRTLGDDTFKMAESRSRMAERIQNCMLSLTRCHFRIPPTPVAFQSRQYPITFCMFDGCRSRSSRRYATEETQPQAMNGACAVEVVYEVLVQCTPFTFYGTCRIRRHHTPMYCHNCIAARFVLYSLLRSGKHQAPTWPTPSCMLHFTKN